jgi:carboxymethylenebutenolidase
VPARADSRTTVQAAGLTIPVETFEPIGDAPHPGVLVIHESFGLNDDIRRISRRFADSGYVAVAPDVRKGGPKCVFRAMRDLRRGEGASLEGLEAVLQQLEAREDVAKVGVAGFCMGGGFALLLACRRPLGAAAAYYAEPPPREQLARACPVVGGWGLKDRMIGRHGKKVKTALTEHGVEHDIELYEDAGHSYMNQAASRPIALLSRPLLHVEYDHDAAEDSWRRMLAFFGRHLDGAAA